VRSGCAGGSAAVGGGARARWMGRWAASPGGSAVWGLGIHVPAETASTLPRSRASSTPARHRGGAGVVLLVPRLSRRVTRHRQRPARRSASPFIAEIPASAETFGCYSCPFLPYKPYVPRYCDGSRLQVRNSVSGQGDAPGTRPRAPRPRSWGLGAPDPREKWQPTRLEPLACHIYRLRDLNLCDVSWLTGLQCSRSPAELTRTYPGAPFPVPAPPHRRRSAPPRPAGR
jgi:hypothetical protein